MDKNQLSKEQQDELNELMLMGEAFEELIRVKGWEYVKAEYATRIQKFVNGLLTQDKIGIEAFEGERRELIGIRKMLGFVESNLQAYQDGAKK